MSRNLSFSEKLISASSVKKPENTTATVEKSNANILNTIKIPTTVIPFSGPIVNTNTITSAPSIKSSIGLNPTTNNTIVNNISTNPNTTSSSVNKTSSIPISQNQINENIFSTNENVGKQNKTDTTLNNLFNLSIQKTETVSTTIQGIINKLTNVDNGIQDSNKTYQSNQGLLVDISRRTDNSNFRIRNIENNSQQLIEENNVLKEKIFSLHAIVENIKNDITMIKKKQLIDGSNIYKDPEFIYEEKDPFEVKKLESFSGFQQNDSETVELSNVVYQILEKINNTTGFPKGLSFANIVIDPQQVSHLSPKITNIIKGEYETDSEYAGIYLYSLAIVVKGILIKDYSLHFPQ